MNKSTFLFIDLQINKRMDFLGQAKDTGGFWTVEVPDTISHG